jgi:serine protease Do
MRRCILPTLSLLMLFGGCATNTIKQVEAKVPIDISPDQKAKPIQFKKIVIKLRRGQEIGRMQGGIFCADMAPLIWQGGKMTLSGDDFTEVFRQELEKANYPVVGDPDALFDDPSEWKAELLVAGLIKEMKANICYPKSGFYDFNTSKGEAYIKVDWQVYSRLDRKVVFRTTTEGSSKIEASSTTGQYDVFLNAFAMATQNLLADQGFNHLVVGLEEKETTDLFEKIIIEKVYNFEQALTEHVTQTRASVVTVFAGEGHGSGFFISQGGYLLTNTHVVGEARMVTVKLVTGREIIGEVVRKNHRRDVALIKVEETNMIALPIKEMEVNVGDKVYVLGTPLKEELASTLSSGIVSGFRIQDDNRFIQSDANILSGSSGGPLLDENGNTIGVTASTFGFRDVPSGLNFFIPIMEALEALNIEIGY